MKILHAHTYVSPRHKPDLTPAEAEVRRISYALKTDDSQACAAAGMAMARLIRSRRCVLVPVPDSRGQTARNRLLCYAIERLHPGAVTVDILCSAPRESQCRLDHAGRHRLAADEIPVTACPIRLPRSLSRTAVYLVDNVCCTGATIEACRRAAATVLPNAIHGLVYARTGQAAA